MAIVYGTSRIVYGSNVIRYDIGIGPGLSLAARQAMFAQETGEAFLILLKIFHPDLDAPYRFVNNNVNVVGVDGAYMAYPFDLVLPDSDEDREVVALLSIDNVSQEITEVIRSLDVPPGVKVSVVRAAAPTEVEVELPEFTLRDVTWDSMAISGELVLSDITSEPYPAHRFIPGYFPGLF
jgi:hypothetical protein